MGECGDDACVSVGEEAGGVWGRCVRVFYEGAGWGGDVVCV